MLGLFAVLAVACAFGVAILTAWRQLRREKVRSPRLERRAASFLASHGLHGSIIVTVNRKEGGRWAWSSYTPSPNDKRPEPWDHGQRQMATLDSVYATFPSYFWTDRRLITLILALALLAGTFTILTAAGVG
jgi:hypothetical protein